MSSPFDQNNAGNSKPPRTSTDHYVDQMWAAVQQRYQDSLREQEANNCVSNIFEDASSRIDQPVMNIETNENPPTPATSTNSYYYGSANLLNQDENYHFMGRDLTNNENAYGTIATIEDASVATAYNRKNNECGTEYSMNQSVNEDCTNNRDILELGSVHTVDQRVNEYFTENDLNINEDLPVMIMHSTSTNYFESGAQYSSNQNEPFFSDSNLRTNDNIPVIFTEHSLTQNVENEYFSERVVNTYEDVSVPITYTTYNYECNGNQLSIQGDPEINEPQTNRDDYSRNLFSTFITNDIQSNVVLTADELAIIDSRDHINENPHRPDTNELNHFQIGPELSVDEVESITADELATIDSRNHIDENPHRPDTNELNNFQIDPELSMDEVESIDNNESFIHNGLGPNETNSSNSSNLNITFHNDEAQEDNLADSDLNEHADAQEPNNFERHLEVQAHLDIPVKKTNRCPKKKTDSKARGNSATSPKNELEGALDEIYLFNKFHFDANLRQLVDKPKKKLEDMTPEEEAYEIFDSYFSNPLGPLDKDPDAIKEKENKLAAKKKPKTKSSKGRKRKPISTNQAVPEGKEKQRSKKLRKPLGPPHSLNTHSDTIKENENELAANKNNKSKSPKGRRSQPSSTTQAVPNEEENQRSTKLIKTINSPQSLVNDPDTINENENELTAKENNKMKSSKGGRRPQPSSTTQAVTNGKEKQKSKKSIKTINSLKSLVRDTDAIKENENDKGTSSKGRNRQPDANTRNRTRAENIRRQRS